MILSIYLIRPDDDYYHYFHSSSLGRTRRRHWAFDARPFHWISLTLQHLVSIARFAARYASRSRNHQYNSQAPHIRIVNATVSPEISDDVALEHAGKFGPPTVIELREYEVKADAGMCPTCSLQTAKSSMERGLCHDRIMEAIAKHLHATDVRNLGQVSPGIRSSLYAHRGTYARRNKRLSEGPSDLSFWHGKDLPSYLPQHLTHADRNELLYNATCASKKTVCWSCEMQICATCTFQARASSPNIQHHIDNCTLYCHRCYFRNVCRHQRSLRHPQRCLHFSTKLNSGLEEATRGLCKPCSLLSTEGVRKRRERREMRVMALLAGQAIRCANCQEGLPGRGPRWWVCNLCALECVDRCHYGGAEV